MVSTASTPEDRLALPRDIVTHPGLAVSFDKLFSISLVELHIYYLHLEHLDALNYKQRKLEIHTHDHEKHVKGINLSGEIRDPE